MTEDEKHPYYYSVSGFVKDEAHGPITASALAKLCAEGKIGKRNQIAKCLTSRPWTSLSTEYKGSQKWVELQDDPLVWALTITWRKRFKSQADTKEAIARIAVAKKKKDAKSRSDQLLSARNRQTLQPFRESLKSIEPDILESIEGHLATSTSNFESTLIHSIKSLAILIADKPLIEDFGLSESDINQLAVLERSINLSIMKGESPTPAGCLSMLAAATLQVLVAMWAFGSSVGSAIASLGLILPWGFLSVGIMFTYQKLIRCPIAKHRLSQHPGRLGWILYQAATRGHDKYLEVQESEREIQRRQDAEHWSTMDEYVFEDEIAELYRKVGYKATRTKGSGDGGFDVFLERSSLITLVECKRHRKPVGPSVIRQLFGVMSMEGAAAGIVVCTGGFSKKAREFAAGDDRITLVDLDGILELAAKADAANG